MADEKIAILNVIRDNKDVLFGKFTNVLTHEVKVEKWKDIAEKVKASGIYCKEWKYLRDTTWQNWRKRTIVSTNMKIIYYIHLKISSHV